MSVPEPAVPLTEWIAAVRRTALAIGLSRGLGPADANDVAQDVVVYALRRIDDLRERYPEPSTLAGARFDHAFADWRRRQSVQRSEGARFQRRHRSLDEGPAGTDLTYADVVPSHDDTADEVDSMLRAAEIRSIVDNCLDRRRADAVMAVKGHGMSVAEYARHTGMARETASRLVNSGVRELAVALAPLAA